MYNWDEHFHFNSQGVRFFPSEEEVDDIGEFEVDLNFLPPPFFRFVNLEDDLENDLRDDEDNIFFSSDLRQNMDFPEFPPFQGSPPGAGQQPPYGEMPNFPGQENYNQPSAPMSKPPNFTPSKSESKSMVYPHGPGVYNVDFGAIRPCAYRFVYIWQRNGRSYWAYLTFVGRRSVAGWRWIGWRWVYFGLDLRRIESFICY
ncbi:MAG: hypothetical protein ABRQ25_11290 [Clostridiaceae bacterium]